MAGFPYVPQVPRLVEGLHFDVVYINPPVTSFGVHSSLPTLLTILHSYTCSIPKCLRTTVRRTSRVRAAGCFCFNRAVFNVT